MNLPARLQGVFSSPQAVFKSLAERPVWLDVLVILLVVIGVFSFLVSPAANKDNLQNMRDNIKLQERLGQERFDQMIAGMENPSPARTAIQSFVMGPLTFAVGLLLSCLILLVLGRMGSTEGTYKQVLSAVVHANLIDKVLGNGVRLVLILMRKSVMQTTTSLALLAPKLPVTSPGYIILSQVDFFQLWMFGILGYGLSAVFKIPLKKALFLSYGFWLLKAAVYVIMALVFTGMMR
ncbi:MAG: YIP1 family protein [Candidatus Aminicenantes bacterium]|nr:YIP1 family protein [Candidatus Aminicenantes bacterium]